MPLRLPLYPGTPAWSDADSAGLRGFLVTPVGQQLLARLLYSRPQVTANEGEPRRVQQDERSGFEACIAEVLALAEPTPISSEDRAAQTLTPSR